MKRPIEEEEEGDFCSLSGESETSEYSSDEEHDAWLDSLNNDSDIVDTRPDNNNMNISDDTKPARKVSLKEAVSLLIDFLKDTTDTTLADHMKTAAENINEEDKKRSLINTITDLAQVLIENGIYEVYELTIDDFHDLSGFIS